MTGTERVVATAIKTEVVVVVLPVVVVVLPVVVVLLLY